MCYLKGLDGSGSLVSRILCQNGWKHVSVSFMKERKNERHWSRYRPENKRTCQCKLPGASIMLSAHATPAIPLQWCKIGTAHICSRQYPSSLPLTKALHCSVSCSHIQFQEAAFIAPNQVLKRVSGVPVTVSVVQVCRTESTFQLA